MIKVGNRVRSFDFSDRPGGRDVTGERACYIEGTVVGFESLEGCERYVIHVKRDGFRGEEKTHRVGSKRYPPVNGTPTLFGDVTDCVELVKEKNYGNS